MKAKKTKQSQQGFLIIVPLILIVIIGMLGGMVAYIYTNTSKAVSGVVTSGQAFYIATSGLELAKRDLIVNNVNCTYFNSTNPTYTNVKLFNGYFSVNGTLQSASGTLNATISSQATTIPLINSYGFLSSGIIKIGNEIISYFGKTGNMLTNAMRGVGDTTPEIHNPGSVTQNMCILTATAGVPDLSSSTGKRTVQQLVMLGYGNGVVGMGIPNNPLPFSITPALLANGGVNVAASATINNPTGKDLGCAIAAVGGVNAPSPASSILCSGVQDPKGIWASNYNNPPPPYTTLINPQNPSLYGYFFTQSINDMIANGVQATAFTPAAINAAAATAIAQGKSIVYFQGGANPPQGDYLTNLSTPITLVINGGVNIGPNVQFGDSNHPIILLVNGGFNQYGGGSEETDISGFVYVNGGANFQTSKFTIDGAVAVNGGVNTFKNSTINFDASILQKLGLLTGNLGTVPIVSTPEIFK